MDDVKEACLKLLERTTDLQAALNEACDQTDLDGCPPTAALPLITAGQHHRDVTFLLKSNAVVLGQSPALLATQYLARAVLQCRGYPLLKQEARHSLDALLALGTHLQNSLIFDSNHFLYTIAHDIANVPLEVVWMLHTHNLLPLESLLCSQEHGETVALNHLTPALVDLSCCVSEHRNAVIQGVACVLARLAFSSDRYTESCSQVCKDVLLRVVKGTFTAEHFSPDHCCYTVCDALVEVSGDVRKRFFTFLVTMLVSSEYVMPATGILAMQEKYKFASLPQHSVTLYTQIAESLGVPASLKLVHQILATEELNWPVLLHFVVCLLNLSPEAAKEMKGLIDSLVDCVPHTGLIDSLVANAVADSHTHSLLCSLILARQASLEGTHIYPLYHEWFQCMFGDSLSTVVSSKKVLQFVLKTLTDIVPYEPAVFLKAHILRPPRRIAKCHGQTSDYITLAKTRLQDLNEPLTDCDTVGGHLELSAATADVDQALDQFKKSKRIPQEVLKASIFRKPYFIGRFLPALLIPPQGETDDVRGQLIEAMARENKIPQRLLSNYQKACRLKSPSPTAVTSECGPVTGPLRQLVQAVANREGSHKLTRMLSKLSSALHSYIQSPVCSSTLLLVDLQSPGLTQWALQLTDCLISAVCECVVAHGDAQHTNRWLSALVEMLAGHNTLHCPLYVRLWELTHVQSAHLSHGHWLGLASLCAALYSTQSALQPLKLTRTDKILNTTRDYSASLVEWLQHHTDNTMKAALRFCCQFVQHLLAHQETHTHLAAPVCLVQKMKYLYKRYSAAYSKHCSEEPPSEVSELLQVVNTCLQVEEFQTVWSSTDTAVPLWLWLKWELKLCSQEDYMSPHARRVYFRNTLCVVYRGKEERGVFIEVFVALVQLDSCGSNRGSWSEGLQMLQEVSCSLPPCDGLPCLLEAIMHTTAVQNSTQSLFKAGRSSSVLQCCLDVLLSLPAHLVFSNSSQGLPSDQTLGLTATFLKENIAPHLSHHFLLPLHLTRHLLMCMDAATRVLELSPLFQASLMHHWPLLTGIRLPPDLLARVEGLSNWIHGCHASLEHDYSPLVLGVCVFAHLMSTQSQPFGLLRRACTEVLFVVFDCCVRELTCYFAPASSSEEARLVAIAHACLSIDPCVSSACQLEVSGVGGSPWEEVLKEVRKHFISPGTLQLLPLVVIRILTDIPDAAMTTLTHQPGFLQLVLSAHATILNLNTNAPESIPEHAIFEPFSINFIRQCTSTAQRVMRQAPNAQLKAAEGSCHHSLLPFLKDLAITPYCPS